MKTEKSCESCRFWTFPGGLPSPARASNEGICLGLDPVTSGRPVPMWAEDLARATISFHGKNCIAWSKRKRPVKVLKKTGR